MIINLVVPIAILLILMIAVIVLAVTLSQQSDTHSEILEEFGCDPNEPHEMIDLQLTQERIERAGAEAMKKQNNTSNTK